MADEEPIKGWQSFFDDLGKLPHALAKIILVREARKAGKIMQTRMEDTAPDDPETPGSQQRDNFDTNVTDQTSSGVDVFTGATKAGFISGFSEFGTAHQPERAYIGPAFDATLKEMMRSIEGGLGDAIEKALLKHG